MSSTPKVKILYPEVPGVRGGTERLAEALCERLTARGVDAVIITLPFRWEPKEELIMEALAWRLVRPDADMVIPLKFPAYFVKHENKVVWLQHQFRQLYDFFGTPYSGFSNNVPDGELREELVAFDTFSLGEAAAIYPNSRNTAERLRKYNGLEGKPLYPPPIQQERLKRGEYGDYILGVGRLEEGKRFDLLLNALAETGGEIKLKIAGSGSQEEPLRGLAAKLGITDRIEFLGSIDSGRMIDLYAGCCAVHFAPYDEDYGLVAVEAMHSARPVITAADSGGPTELVRHGNNGFVLPPEPRDHARALETLWHDRSLCGQMGAQGANDVESITWDRTIDELLTWLET